MARNVRTTYTAQEIEALKQLIRLRVKADRSAQKSIRDKMRDMGFYGSEFGIRDCQVSDLEHLINCGVIKVIGKSTPSSSAVAKMPNPVVSREIALPTPAPAIKTVASKDVENKLINGPFIAVSSMTDSSVPDVSGLYCIKLRKGVVLPAKFGKVREDGIIYIGQASRSLKKRFWEQELNHKSAATFFRSLGAILGYLPPKGSLYGKATRNYKFSPEDTDAIKKWMRQSLLVNWIPFGTSQMDTVETNLIIKYRPLVNIDDNPTPSEALKAARKHCVEYAKSR